MHAVSAGTPDALAAAVADEIRAIRGRLAQDAPSADELERSVREAVRIAGGDDALRRLHESGRLREVVEQRPFNLEMDIVNKCNLRCVMCMMSHPSHFEQPLRRFPLERFEQLADEIFWHVNALSFTYGAEPLLHPQFAQFVEIAGRYRIPRVYAISNGQLLTEPIVRAAVEHRMHALTISVDAACRETYERIRVGGDWERLMANLRMLQRIKKEVGSERPHVELAFVMMRSNIRELPRFVELAHELGAGSATANHMVPFQPLATAGESCWRIKETTNEMLRRARDTAARLGLPFPSPQLFGEAVRRDPAANGVDRFGLPVSASTRQRGHCPFPWHFAAIDMRGDIVPCGWWNGSVAMGNIGRDSFLSIWNNDAYRRLRAEHREGSLCATCQRCPAGGLGSVDDAIAFAER